MHLAIYYRIATLDGTKTKTKKTCGFYQMREVVFERLLLQVWLKMSTSEMKSQCLQYGKG